MYIRCCYISNFIIHLPTNSNSCFKYNQKLILNFEYLLFYYKNLSFILFISKYQILLMYNKTKPSSKVKHY